MAHPLNEGIQRRDSYIYQLCDLSTQLLHDACKRALQHAQLKGQSLVNWSSAPSAVWHQHKSLYALSGRMIERVQRMYQRGRDADDLFIPSAASQHADTSDDAGGMQKERVVQGTSPIALNPNYACISGVLALTYVHCSLIICPVSSE